MSVVTPSPMRFYDLPNKSFYNDVVEFFPFAGGKQSWGWGGGIDGLDGSFEETCEGCSYKNGDFYNWGNSTFIRLSGYGEHIINYKCERLHERTGNKYQYISDRVITLKCKPSISGIDNVLPDKRKGFSLDFSVTDDTPNIKLSVYVSLDDKVIQTFNNVLSNSNLTAIVTDEQINSFSQGVHTLKIRLNDGYDNFYRTYTFWKKDKGINISTSLVTDSQTKFTVTKIYSELTKIEWYLDGVLKETFTTDVYSEKTLDYTLEDNAIHTLKIVATDAENVVEEKVISISKAIMPLQEDATLQDISTKLVEIGEGFKNGKTSIINTLASKNVEANLNNTLVELSEKIKLSFNSGDASLQELQNKITELNNQLSQRKRWAKGTASLTISYANNSIQQQIETNLSFRPSIILIKTNLFFTNSGFDNYDCNLYSANNLTETYAVNANKNTGPGRAGVYAQIGTISEKSFFLNFTTSLYFNISQNSPITWYAFE